MNALMEPAATGQEPPLHLNAAEPDDSMQS
jgi:hypothetical protein